MKLFSATLFASIALASVSFASWPSAGWKGPYTIRAGSSQVSISNNVYTWNFYINGPAETGSWCGSDNPLKFSFSSGEQSQRSIVAAQATVLSALASGSQIKAKFKGYDGCAVEDVVICGEGSSCNPQ